MDALIIAEQVSKRFDIHHNRAHALKTRILGTVYKRYRPRIEEFWALRDVSLTVGRGEAAGSRRPERLGQEHAAQAHCRHPSPVVRARAGSP